MRGAPHHRSDNVPREHAKAPSGEPLCGTKRKWGVLFVPAGHQPSCVRCRAKLHALASSAPERRRCQCGAIALVGNPERCPFCATEESDATQALEPAGSQTVLSADDAGEAEATRVIADVLGRAAKRISTAQARRRRSVKIDTEEAWLIVKLAESTMRRLQDLRDLNRSNETFFAALKRFADAL